MTFQEAMLIQSIIGYICLVAVFSFWAVSTVK
jgi:hypothetical protein